MLKIERKVFYDDTDGGGVVYHANYLKYMDHARSEYLAHLGFELDRLVSEHGILFAVVDVAVRYRIPARLSDHLEISANLVKHTAARMVFEQKVCRYDAERNESQCLAEGQVVLACLNALEFRPCAIPDFVKERLIRDA